MLSCCSLTVPFSDHFLFLMDETGIYNLTETHLTQMWLDYWPACENIVFNKLLHKNSRVADVQHKIQSLAFCFFYFRCIIMTHVWHILLIKEMYLIASAWAWWYFRDNPESTLAHIKIETILQTSAQQPWCWNWPMRLGKAGWEHLFPRQIQHLCISTSICLQYLHHRNKQVNITD